MAPPAASARRPGERRAAASAAACRKGRAESSKVEEDCVLAKERALQLQRDLRTGFAAETFQKLLKELHGRYEVRTPAFAKERSALFMTVQSVVLRKHGYAGNFAGLSEMLLASTAFKSDRDFVRIANENCCLLGLHEHMLPDPQEPKRSVASTLALASVGVDGEKHPGIEALLHHSIHVYYMNVSSSKSSTSQRRQRIQEDMNPMAATDCGYFLLPRRVPAVTPDSDAWKEAKAEYGELVMDSGGKDSWSGAAANCILLSFREALRYAELDTARDGGPAFVVIAEDDMMLEKDFNAIFEAAAAELWRDPVAMGAMLHSASLAENMLQSVSRGPALRAVWPRYPPVPVVKRRHSTTWPGHPVIPDQPLVALLKSERLKEFIALYEDRLRYSGWSPLDWILANAPFGESGVLRLIARNGFCKGGDQVGTGSVRSEQDKAGSQTAPVLHHGLER